MSKKTFGRLPSGERLEQIKASPNYQDNNFRNIEPTSVMAENVSFFKLLRNFTDRPKTINPPKPLPNVVTDLKKLDPSKNTIVWFGHSSYLLNAKGFIILTDPVLSGHASPVTFFGKAFPGADIYKPANLPMIDLLVLTHDHYDHLDYKTILDIHKNVKQIVTPLGVGAHLEYWGVEKDKITELDWWENKRIDKSIEITSTPARHFSGRSITRAKSLWSSYVLELDGIKLFLGGDSGYDKQFEKIGEKFGPFDLAMLECGQYGKDWPMIHMTPEETVQAAKDLQARVVLPVHWGKFVLSNHPWNEPIKRFVAKANLENQKFVTPMIGQPVSLGEDFGRNEWWNL